MSYHEVILAATLFLTVVKGTIYDETQLHRFMVSGRSTLTVSTNVYKHGGRSLQWSWQPRDTLTLLLHDDPVDRTQFRRGGAKLWLYLEQRSHGNLTVAFYTSYLLNHWRASQPECRFEVSLDFQGWRGVWVRFQECHTQETILPLYRMMVHAPRGHAGSIYFDLLRIVRTTLFRQSRDHIVPPIMGRVAPLRQLWQHTYRWSLVKPKVDIFNEIELNHEQFKKLKEIRLIRFRLEKWFDARKSTYDYTGYYRNQWKYLHKVIRSARMYYNKLNLIRVDGFIRGPPLFSRNSEYGERVFKQDALKFGFVMRYVLLPLSLEHYFLTRRHEVDRMIREELGSLNNPDLALRALERLFDGDQELLDVFYESSNKVGPLTKSGLRYALNMVNHKRLERLFLLLDYIEDQGWQTGSGLGSLDHELNRSGKGFVTSIFLLRVPLMRAGRLHKMIDTMKWYLEFGELYQEGYEYSGTTCDRMRTLMLFRLMCVVIMPEVTLQESLRKLRDMAALRDWYENALKINTGLGGVIKPDYTGYHHKSFYPKAYVLPALVTAARVVYLLRGTAYEVSEASRRNLRKAVHFMRLLAAKYIFPTSVSNSAPRRTKHKLVCLMPAFAYLSIAELESRRHKFSWRWSPPKTAVDSLRALLRFLDESEKKVRVFLSRGVSCRAKASLMYSIGSVDIIHRARRRAKELGIEAERSPEGNWAKNYAALAIHRREDWVVTVKGFNNFVWGHESSTRGNQFGLYQSYGQIVISNGDKGMKVYDIDRGWDWTRPPGTTTMRVRIRDLMLVDSVYYNPKPLCGAVTFKGTSRLRNGAFVIDFQSPDYKMDSTQFWFKKSVFFYNDLIVCLGSDINARMLRDPVEIETTLFQNFALIDGRERSVTVQGYEIPVTKGYYARRMIWGRNSAAMLMDVNGNGYYVRRAGEQRLNLRLGNQTSYHQKLKIRTEGQFATAWLRHGVNPVNANYEYAILANTTYQRLYKFACAQEKLLRASTPPKYEVLQQDRDAHVIKFNNAPRVGLATFAYSVFSARVELAGPVRMVGDPCVFMVEHGGQRSPSLILGISYPQLNFNSTRKMRTAYDAKEAELFYMRSMDKQIWILLKENVRTSEYRVYVDGEPVDPSEAGEHVSIVPNYPDMSVGSLVKMNKLVNGFTTEVHFQTSPSSILT